MPVNAYLMHKLTVDACLSFASYLVRECSMRTATQAHTFIYVCVVHIICVCRCGAHLYMCVGVVHIYICVCRCGARASIQNVGSVRFGCTLL